VGYGALLSAKDKDRRQWKMRNKKLLSLVLALAFVFSAMGLAFAPSSAMAANTGQFLEGNAIPPTTSPDCSTYEVVSGEISTGSITVTLVIEAGNSNAANGNVEQGTAFRREITKTIGADGSQNTVKSLLMAVNGEDDLFFPNLTASTDYLDVVEIDGGYNATWEEGTWGLDGWVFRVNDKFPVQFFTDEQGQTGWRGTEIHDTPLYDGNVVHFFYDFPSNFFGGNPPSGDLAANYVRAVYKGFVPSDDKKLTVQLQGHKTYILQNYPDYIMSVYNYEDLGSGVIASLYKKENGVLTLVQGGQPSWADGTVTFSGNVALASGGTYVVKTVPTYYYTTNTTWDDRVNTAYFILTGAYSEITIP
jgi:hypothetical protein